MISPAKVASRGALACARRVGLVLLALCAQAHAEPRSGSIRSIDPPAAPGSMAPNLALDGESVLLTWLEPQGAGHALQLARLSGGRWKPLATIARGDRFFVNAADFPSVASGGDGALVAHWLEKSAPATYAYDVQLARSTDAGASWTPLGRAHRDGTRTEHGFVSMVPEARGVRAFWLDGREMSEVPGDPGGGPMTLRTASIGSAVGASERIDERVCDCCQTSAALTADGPVVVYRDRSADEVRDIWIVRRAAGGWSRPAPVHEDAWEIFGCPVNGPAIASDAARALAVAWFTGHGNRPLVQVAFSRDAGRSFGAPVRVDPVQPIGRVGVVLTEGGEAIVSWVAMPGGDRREEVRLMRVAPDGATGAPLLVSSPEDAPSGGLPRLVRWEDELVMAWAGGGRAGRLRAVRLPVSLVPQTDRPGAAPSARGSR